MHRPALLPVFLLAAASPLPAAMSIFGYDANVHDRFDSTSFLGASYDLSGIGRSDDSKGRWATMISSEYFVSADHFHPTVGSTLTFHEDNDSAGPVVTRTVLSGTQIGTTDIWLGKLSSPLPASIATYDIAAPGADVSTSLGAYADALVYQVGLRDDWNVGGTTNFALGLNHIEIGDATSEELGSFNTIGFIKDEAGDSQLENPGETFFVIGDSGAPSFLDVGGDLVIAGLHSYVTTGLSELSITFSDFVDTQSPGSAYQTPGTQTRDISYDVFLANYRDDVLTTAGLTVPEPASFALAAGILAFGAAWRIRATRRS